MRRVAYIRPALGPESRAHSSILCLPLKKRSFHLCAIRFFKCASLLLVLAGTPVFAVLLRRFAFALSCSFYFRIPFRCCLLFYYCALYASLLFLLFLCFSYVFRLDRCQVSHRLATIHPVGAHLMVLAQSPALIGEVGPKGCISYAEYTRH